MWPAIAEVRRLPEHLAIGLYPRGHLLVPRRCCRDDQQFAALEQFIAERIEATPRFRGWAEPGEAPRIAMEEDQQSASFLLTGRDIARMRFDGLHGKPPSLLVGVLTTFVLALWAALTVPANGSTPMRGLLLAASVIGAGFFLAGHAKRVIWRRWWDRGQYLPQTIVLSAQGVLARDALSSGFDGWSVLEPVQENDEYLVFVVRRDLLGHVVPKRAFASREECERFVQAARGFWQRADEVSQNPFRDPAQVAAGAQDSGNPYQAPQSG